MDSYAAIAITLSLPSTTALESPWVAGRDKNERIFVKAGGYEVVLTDALESDAPGIPTFRCVVQYQP